MLTKEVEEFLKECSCIDNIIYNNVIFLKLKKVGLNYNFKKHKVILIIFNEHFENYLLDQLLKQIDNNYYVINCINYEYYIECKFAIRKIKDLYEVIDLINSYVLIAEMSK